MSATHTALWRAAKLTSVATAVGVVGLLLFRPEVGLFVTWNVLVPAVPALLLVAPQVWRNLCPIAVVHQLPAAVGRGGRRSLSPRARAAAPAVAALLLFIIVPLRPALLNRSGPALAVFVLLVLAIAVAGGFARAGKSGWCATWCPVLPVERLYGQDPLIRVTHAHCPSCSACVRACHDLRPDRSFAKLLDGPSPLRTPTGLFAAGFPGFVLGYFTAPVDAAIPLSYLRIAAFVVASVAVFEATRRLSGFDARRMARIAAATAVALYYWFTVPAVAAAAHTLLDIPPAPAAGIGVARTAFLLLAVAWLVVPRGRGRRRTQLHGARP